LDDGSLVVFGLKGVVYYGDFHYTAQIFTGGSVWFHDGMVSGKKCTYEKRLTEFTGSELSTCTQYTGGRMYVPCSSMQSLLIVACLGCALIGITNLCIRNFKTLIYPLTYCI
jgi:hypothetical protein